MGHFVHVSDRFLNEIRRSHEVVSYIQVITPVREVITVEATEGEVSVDGTASVRRSCSFSCVDPEGIVTPKDAHSALTPFGTEIIPWRGVRYADGEVEVHPLGVFRISQVEVKDTSSGGVQIRVQAYDYSRTIARDKFREVYTIAAGTNIVAAIKTLVERTFPDVEYNTVSTAMTVTSTKVFDVQDDPWEAIGILALSIGCRAYFDIYGRFTLSVAEDVDATSLPDFTYIEGPGCTMLDLGASYRDDPGFNGVVVIGESMGDEKPPVRAEAWDDEPTSPTYRYGPYGQVPMFHTDQNVKTEDEAQVVANQLLTSLIGVSVGLSITSLVNPTLEAGNIVEVFRAKSNVSGMYTLDAFNVPLASTATQNLTIRQKRFGVSGNTND